MKSKELSKIGSKTEPRVEKEAIKNIHTFFLNLMDCLSFDKKMYILRNIMQIKQVSKKNKLYVIL